LERGFNPPDFYIETEEGKKIGIEIVRIDTSEQITEEYKMSTVRKIGLDEPDRLGRELSKKIKDKISKLKRKLENPKKHYEEIWLYLYPFTIHGALEIYIYTEEEFQKFYKRDLLSSFKQCIGKDEINFFDEIFLWKDRITAH